MAPKRPRSPQEKKALSLQKDRRNRYGENDKASRKAIPAAKARSHRIVRRADKQALADGEDALETVALVRCKPHWRKVPDVPLGEVIAGKPQRLQWLVTRNAMKRKPESDEAE
jgi:hypothetical protein